MRITAITQQKRDPSRYNIFIDGAYAFALPMQDILPDRPPPGRRRRRRRLPLSAKT